MVQVSKLNLRLPPDLREAAQQLANYQGISLNALCCIALRSHVQYQGKVLGHLSQAPPRRQPAKPAATVSIEDEPEALPQQVIRVTPKVGANQPCPCGSGQKYKRCHGRPA